MNWTPSSVFRLLPSYSATPVNVTAQPSSMRTGETPNRFMKMLWRHATSTAWAENMEACPGVPVVSMHQVVGGELLELLLFGQQRTVQLPVENENHCVDHGPKSLNCSTSWLPPCLGGSVGREPDSLLDALPWSANEFLRFKNVLCSVF